MGIVIYLKAAMLCFNIVGHDQCYPILVGDSPVGVFQGEIKTTKVNGYKGSIISFFETEKDIYAIHRILNSNSKENRQARIGSNIDKNRNMTNGCINVRDDLFEYLEANCVLGCQIDIKE